MEKNKIFRYGIDRLILGNLGISDKGDWKKVTFTRGLDRVTRQHQKTEFISIRNDQIYCISSGKDRWYDSQRLEVNLPKILTADNCRNVNRDDLDEAIQKVEEILKERFTIKVDFSDALIKGIEINLNLPFDFQEYAHIYKLIGICWPECKSTSNEKDGQIETLLCKLPDKSSFTMYDKSKKEGIPFPITRFEFKISQEKYARIMENKLGKSNRLYELLNTDGLIKTIFLDQFHRRATEKKIYKILNERKAVLATEYLQLKKNNKLMAQSSRAKSYGVWRKLGEKQIFDCLDLVEIAKRYDRNHWKREKENILRMFGEKDGYHKLIQVLDYMKKSE